MPIHVKEDLIVELALMHKYGIITVLSFSAYASPIFAQTKPNGKCVSLWISGKSTPWLQMNTLTIITSQHFLRRSTTPGRQFPVRQTWLLPGLSLFADGGPTVSGNDCFQFCQQNFCL